MGTEARSAVTNAASAEGSDVAPPWQETPSGIDAEFVELTARNVQRMPVPAFLICLFIGLLALPHFNGTVILVWIVLIGAFLLFRWSYLSRLPARTDLDDARKVRIIVGANIVGALLQGSSIVFFPFLPVEDRAFHSLLLTGLAAGVVISTAGHKASCIPYVLLTIVPLSLAWAAFPASENGPWKEYGFAALGLVFAAILYAIARDTFALFKEAVEMRAQQAVLNRELNGALRESERSNSAKTRFLASASHDLRQPVHTLSLLVAALKMRKLDPQTTEISNTLGTSVASLSAQLDALLDISKLDAGIVKPEIRAYDLVANLRRLCDEFTPLAEEKNITLQLKSGSTATVSSDPVLLECIFRNLLSNAIKYTDVGSIDIEVGREGGSVICTVSDSGIGIEADEHAHVFDEFYQLNNPSRERAKGLGLGLSIVKRMSALLHVGVTLHSVPSEGTSFVLSIPAADGAVRHADPVPVAHDEADDGVAGTNVLVVDDEADVRVAMRECLQAMQCRVRLAETVERAVLLAAEGEPDILIVDFRLDDGNNGLDLVSTLRESYPALPALMITGDTAPARLRQAARADVTLLHKPLDVAVLKSTMRSLLAGEPGQAPRDRGPSPASCRAIAARARRP